MSADRQETIAIRLPPETITALREAADAEGVGYTVLVRRWIMAGLAGHGARDPRMTAPRDRRRVSVSDLLDFLDSAAQ